MKGGVVQKVFELSECAICRGDDATPTRILQPCGHKCICDGCIDVLAETTTLCPVCRQQTTNLHKSLLIIVWMKFVLVFLIHVLVTRYLNVHFYEKDRIVEFFLLQALDYYIFTRLGRHYFNIIIKNQ